MFQYKNFLNGKWVDSKSTQRFDVKCPLTQDVIAQTPLSTEEEFNAAVANAKDTFQTWSKTPISQRVRYMLKYQQLLKEHQDELAALITKEHGKTLVDSAGDVFRGDRKSVV